MKNNSAEEECENLSMQHHLFRKFREEIFSCPVLCHRCCAWCVFNSAVIQAVSGTFSTSRARGRLMHWSIFPLQILAVKMGKWAA